ncbi:MAG: hypothetical protein FJZ98_06425 [Chloroflexi bacterium]|nr:hypothetical protein [Chloroflexota bacterium]
MRKNIAAVTFLLLVFLTGCARLVQISEPTIPPQASPIVEILQTSEPAAQKLLEFPDPDPQTIMVDIAAKPCSISWSNNGEYLPCPGILDDISGGHVSLTEDPVINGAILVNQSALLTIPAQSDSSFRAIFGKLPPYTVKTGDRFKAVLACADGHPNCDATISLEYYTSDNQILTVTGAEWQVTYNSSGGYVYADASLEALAGRTLQFLLAVRDNGDASDDYILWIQPQIVNVDE